MIIDTSAIIAITKQEGEAARLSVAILLENSRLMSSASYLETSIVMQKRFVEGDSVLDPFLERLKIEIMPFTAAQSKIAREAHRKYRKGKAGLNFGDCFAYALAKDLDLPLLFKGTDFAQTDVGVVPY